MMTGAGFAAGYHRAFMVAPGRPPRWPSSPGSARGAARARARAHGPR